MCCFVFVVFVDFAFACFVFRNSLNVEESGVLDFPARSKMFVKSGTSRRVWWEVGILRSKSEIHDSCLFVLWSISGFCVVICVYVCVFLLYV